LPKDAKTPSTRFRLWQPKHSGKGYNQWAVDEMQLGQYENLPSLEDDFNVCLKYNCFYIFMFEFVVVIYLVQHTVIHTVPYYCSRHFRKKNLRQIFITRETLL
jgi:hypothetical protein